MSDRNGYCPHGVYVGGMGVDWMCGRCEDGEAIVEVDGRIEVRERGETIAVFRSRRRLEAWLERRAAA